jgi:hypothetical protein
LSLASVVGVSAGGAGIGLLILYVDWPFPDDTATFTGSDAYGLWVSLICLDIAVWALLLFPILDSLRALSGHWRGNALGVFTSLGVYSVLLVAFVVATSLLLGLPNEIPYLRVKLLMFGLVGSIVSVVAAAGILLVHAALSDRSLAHSTGGHQPMRAFCNFELICND